MFGVVDVTSFVSRGGCEWIRRRGVFRSPGRALGGCPTATAPLGGGRQLEGALGAGGGVS
jgi:hypothetical protein